MREYHHLTKLDNKMLKGIIDQKIESLSELSDPKEVNSRLERKKGFRETRDAMVADERKRFPKMSRGISTDVREPKDREKSVRESLVIDVQGSILDIVQCQEILEERGVKIREIDISRMPPKIQALFIAIYQQKTGKKFVPAKPKGRFSLLATKTRKTIGGIGKIFRRKTR